MRLDKKILNISPSTCLNGLCKNCFYEISQNIEYIKDIKKDDNFVYVVEISEQKIIYEIYPLDTSISEALDHNCHLDKNGSFYCQLLPDSIDSKFVLITDMNILENKKTISMKCISKINDSLNFLPKELSKEIISYMYPEYYKYYIEELLK